MMTWRIDYGAWSTVRVKQILAVQFRRRSMVENASRSKKEVGQRRCRRELKTAQIWRTRAVGSSTQDRKAYMNFAARLCPRVNAWEGSGFGTVAEPRVAQLMESLANRKLPPAPDERCGINRPVLEGRRGGDHKGEYTMGF